MDVSGLWFDEPSRWHEDRLGQSRHEELSARSRRGDFQAVIVVAWPEGAAVVAILAKFNIDCR